MSENNFKSGFVAIVGMPNVGKSTLLNALVGQKIAIISDKPQTTRNKILAIRTNEKSQIIFVDTPGIHRPRTKLGEYMVNVAGESARDADVVVMVTEAGRDILLGEEELIASLNKWQLPSILVINKIDTVRMDTVLPIIDKFSKMHEFDAIIPISAKKDDGLDTLITGIEDLLIEGPEFYPSDMVTDLKERELTAEIIREKLLLQLDKEVPHGIAIEVLSFEEDKIPLRISANIYCEKDSHKGIIIGKQGAMLKKIGSLARVELEDVFEKKVFLELWVKVKSDWRNSSHYIKDFGYQ